MLYRDSEKNKIISVANQNYLTRQVRRSIEISDDHPNAKNVIPLLPNYHEQRLYSTPLSLTGISNPRPGLTPGTALCAVGSGIKYKPFVNEKAL